MGANDFVSDGRGICGSAFGGIGDIVDEVPIDAKEFERAGVKAARCH
jgi:hypothetical protein